MRARRFPSSRDASAVVVALGLLACPGLAGAGHWPLPPESEFPPTTAVPSVTLRVGDQLTVGGPLSDNFLPDTRMKVYVVPHRTWREGDPLGTNAVHRGEVKSDAKGKLPLTRLWKPDRAGQYDVVVDYDGNGKFSYGLDALHAIDVLAR
jgi:hypothetical protein